MRPVLAHLARELDQRLDLVGLAVVVLIGEAVEGGPLRALADGKHPGR